MGLLPLCFALGLQMNSQKMSWGFQLFIGFWGLSVCKAQLILRPMIKPQKERFSGLILGVCEGKIHIQYHSNCEDQLQCWLLMVEISLFGSVTDWCCSLTPFTGLKERDGTSFFSSVPLSDGDGGQVRLQLSGAFLPWWSLTVPSCSFHWPLGNSRDLPVQMQIFCKERLLRLKGKLMIQANRLSATLLHSLHCVWYAQAKGKC